MKILQEQKGLLIALSVILLWAGNLVVFLSLPFEAIPVSVKIGGILLQTFLFTGLFITAHDAMHGTVYRKNRRTNDFVGRLAVFLYALFSFRALQQKHAQHHKHPASEYDPDYHDGEHPGFFSWYFHFLLSYVRWPQIIGMAIVYNLFIHLLGVGVLNASLFWVLPVLLSTFQLFYFGTYLPHREPAGGYEDEHRSVSNDFSTLVSFLTCYHFGYHKEHHEFPGIPWWDLPRKRRELIANTDER